MTDKTTEALKLAEQDKQEPVVNLFDVKKKAFEQLRLEVKAPEDKWTVGDSINFFGFYSHGFEAGIKYAAPVDAKAIRAEALEEAAKVCDFENHQLTGMRMDNEAWAAKNCAAAIRARGEK